MDKTNKTCLPADISENTVKIPLPVEKIHLKPLSMVGRKNIASSWHSVKNKTFEAYVLHWLQYNKQPYVDDNSYKKYLYYHTSLKMIDNNTLLEDMDIIIYQKIINQYAKNYEYESLKCFHHILRAAVSDAIDNGIILFNFTRKTQIYGRGKLALGSKKNTVLSHKEIQRLVNTLDLDQDISYDHFFYLMLKTGLRYGEALALVPSDFNFINQTLSIERTISTFAPHVFKKTKTAMSKRVIHLDEKTNDIFYHKLLHLDDDGTISLNNLVFRNLLSKNGTIVHKYFLEELDARCINAGVSIITLHALRHSHATLLYAADNISVHSISKRLGHRNTAITNKVYLHLTKEMLNNDNSHIIELLNNL